MGMTGSGKTGLGIDMIEEALLNGISCLVIDPQGDMGNLALDLPGLTGADFEPWIDGRLPGRKALGFEGRKNQTVSTRAFRRSRIETTPRRAPSSSTTGRCL